MLRPGRAPHPPVLQEGEEALEEEVEGEEGTVEAKREVVLLGVDELVTFAAETKHEKHIFSSWTGMLSEV